MSIYNLAYPWWHPVPCNKPVNVDVVCANIPTKEKQLPHTYNPDPKEYCQRKLILVQKKCYFISKDITDTVMTDSEFQYHHFRE